MSGFRVKKDIDVIIKIINTDHSSDFSKSIDTWHTLSKKCLPLLRDYFSNVRNWFMAQDEIRMCCSRIGMNEFIKEMGDVPYENLFSFGIARYSVNEMNERKLLDNELAQLRYFLNLQKCSLQPGSFNKEACPVCYEELGIKWVVLLCSHFLCHICYQQSIKRIDQEILDCPVCRFSSPINEIFLVDQSTNKQIQNDKKFTGPTKISKIIEIVHQIKSSYSNDKILIFSEWESVLDLCGTHLKNQNFKFCKITTINNLKSELPCFEKNHISILLILLRLGSKGINITCANHVIFADICPNIHDEVQAIGRCHRIGQKKSIFVYHPFMKATIEEKIYKQRNITESFFVLKSKKIFTGNEANEVLKFIQDK